MKYHWIQIGFGEHNPQKKMPSVPSCFLEQIRIKRFLTASSDRPPARSPSLPGSLGDTLSCWSCEVSSPTFSSKVVFSASRFKIWVCNPLIVTSFSSGQPPLPAERSSLTGVMKRNTGDHWGYVEEAPDFFENCWKPEMFIWPNLEKFSLWIVPSSNTLLFSHLVWGWLRHCRGLRQSKLPQTLQLLSQGPVAPVIGESHIVISYVLYLIPKYIHRIYRGHFQLKPTVVIIKTVDGTNPAPLRGYEAVALSQYNDIFHTPLSGEGFFPSTVYSHMWCDTIGGQNLADAV